MDSHLLRHTTVTDGSRHHAPGARQGGSDPSGPTGLGRDKCLGPTLKIQEKKNERNAEPERGAKPWDPTCVQDACCRKEATCSSSS